MPTLYLSRAGDHELDANTPAVTIGDQDGTSSATVYSAGHTIPATVTPDGVVTWFDSRTSCGGHLYLSRDQSTAHGLVSSDGSPAYGVFGTPLPPTSYATKITTVRQADGTDPSQVPADGWVDGPALTLGYQLDPITGFPVNVTTLGGQDVTPYVNLNTTGDVLTLGVEIDPAVVCSLDPSMLCALTVDFTVFGDALSGTVSATCADQGPADGTYLITGQAAGELLAVSERYAPLLDASAEPADSTQAVGATASGLSLAELLSLVPDQSVGNEASSLLVENTKWAVARRSDEKDWVPQLFGDQPPVLPQSRIDVITPDLGWYQDTFAVAYLGWALDSIDGPGAPSVHLNDTQRAKLKTFMTRGLGESEAYGRQATALAQTAYLTVKQRLRLYVDDATNDWGQLLFDAVTTPNQLTLTANRIAAEHDASSASGVATMLHLFDSSGKLAGDYQRLLMARVLMNASLQSQVDDLDLTLSWLPDMLKAFATAYEDAQNPDTQEVARELNAAAEEFGDFVELAKVFAAFYMQFRGKGLARQSEDAAAAFARQYPQFAGASKAMFIIAWAGGMLNVIVAFVNWDDLNPTDKAKAITTLTGLVGDAADSIVGLIKEPPSYEIWVELQDFTGRREILQQFGEVPEQLAGDDWVLVGGRATEELFDAETRTIITTGSRWERCIAAAEKVVAGIGVAVSAALAVLSTIDFINDIRDGKPISKVVLDGLLAVANIASTVCLTLGLFVAETVFLLAASVLALVGAVITIIELFIPEPPTPRPADTFMRDHAIPFVNTLPAAA